MIAWIWTLKRAYRSYLHRKARTKAYHKGKGRDKAAYDHRKFDGIEESSDAGPGLEFCDVPERVLANLAEPVSYTRMSAMDAEFDTSWSTQSFFVSAHNRRTRFGRSFSK